MSRFLTSSSTYTLRPSAHIARYSSRRFAGISLLKELGQFGSGREVLFGQHQRQIGIGTGRRNMSTKTVAVLAADELKDGQMYAL